MRRLRLLSEPSSRATPEPPEVFPAWYRALVQHPEHDYSRAQTPGQFAVIDPLFAHRQVQGEFRRKVESHSNSGLSTLQARCSRDIFFPDHAAGDRLLQAVLGLS